MQQRRRREALRHEDLDELDQDDRRARQRPHQRQKELPRAGTEILQPRALAILRERNAAIEVQRAPRARVADIVRLAQEFGEGAHMTCSICNRYNSAVERATVAIRFAASVGSSSRVISTAVSQRARWLASFSP